MRQEPRQFCGVFSAITLPTGGHDIVNVIRAPSSNGYYMVFFQPLWLFLAVSTSKVILNLLFLPLFFRVLTNEMSISLKPRIKIFIKQIKQLYYIQSLAKMGMYCVKGFNAPILTILLNERHQGTIGTINQARFDVITSPHLYGRLFHKFRFKFSHTTIIPQMLNYCE